MKLQWICGLALIFFGCSSSPTLNLTLETLSGQIADPLAVEGLHFKFIELVSPCPVSILDGTGSTKIIPFSGTGLDFKKERFTLDTSSLNQNSFYGIEVYAGADQNTALYTGRSDCPYKPSNPSLNAVTVCFGQNYPTGCVNQKTFTQCCIPGCSAPGTCN